MGITTELSYLQIVLSVHSLLATFPLKALLHVLITLLNPLCQEPKLIHYSLQLSLATKSKEVIVLTTHTHHHHLWLSLTHHTQFSPLCTHHLPKFTPTQSFSLAQIVTTTLIPCPNCHHTLWCTTPVQHPLSFCPLHTPSCCPLHPHLPPHPCPPSPSLTLTRCRFVPVMRRASEPRVTVYRYSPSGSSPTEWLWTRVLRFEPGGGCICEWVCWVCVKVTKLSHSEYCFCRFQTKKLSHSHRTHYAFVVIVKTGNY